MSFIGTWSILIASIAVLSDATLFPFRFSHFLQALSPYEFNVTKNGRISKPSSASVTFYVKPKGGTFGRKKREASPEVQIVEEEKGNLEERDGKVLFRPARWDFSPTSGAAATVGIASALSGLMWTVIHEAKKTRNRFPDGITPQSATSAMPLTNSFGTPYGSQYAPSPYYPSYESYYPAPPKGNPPKGKPPKLFNPMKGLKAMENQALKGIVKLQNAWFKPSKQKKKKKQKPSYFSYHPPTMPYYPSAPAYAPELSYTGPDYNTAPSYPAPSPASSYVQPPEPSYPAPAPAPSYVQSPEPSYPAPDYNPPPSYPAAQAPAPSYVQPREPVHPRGEAPTYGVAPTPEPYIPPPTLAPYVPPPTPAPYVPPPTPAPYAPPPTPYVPPPTPAPYVPPPTPAPYVPPPTPAPYVPPPTPAPYVPPPTPAPYVPSPNPTPYVPSPVTTTAPGYNPPAPSVPIQYESFIPIGPLQRQRHLSFPVPQDAPIMVGPRPKGTPDTAIIPSQIDPTPFIPSPEEGIGLWGRPSEEVMNWLTPEIRETDAYQDTASIPSDSATAAVAGSVSDATEPSSAVSVVTPVKMSLAEPAVTSSASTIRDEPGVTTPVPS